MVTDNIEKPGEWLKAARGWLAQNEPRPVKQLGLK